MRKTHFERRTLDGIFTTLSAQIVFFKPLFSQVSNMGRQFISSQIGRVKNNTLVLFYFTSCKPTVCHLLINCFSTSGTINILFVFTTSNTHWMFFYMKPFTTEGACAIVIPRHILKMLINCGL